MTDLEVYAPGEPLPPAPRPAGPSDEAWETAAAWLATLRSPRSRDAYQRDVTGRRDDYTHRWTLDPAPGASPAPFFVWCTVRGIDPLDTDHVDVTLWLRWLDGFDLAAATTARKVSALRRYFRYAVDVARVMPRNPLPAENADLHLDPVPRESTTRGLTEDEVKAMRRAARDYSPRDGAILAVLYHQGLRVSELADLNVADARGTDRGHRTLAVFGKGRKRRLLVLAPSAAHEIDAYLADRAAQGTTETAPTRLDDLAAASTPLFVSDTGRRLTRRQVDHIVARAARTAGIAGTVTPHVLRHACITHMRDRGQGIADVQAHAGHSSPETTQRYDRRREHLDRSPAYVLPSPDAWSSRSVDDGQVAPPHQDYPP